MNIKIKLPLLLEAEFELNFDKKDQIVAWELHCELLTRIGVNEFIEDEDLVIYCIDSWYNFFKFARDKIKTLGPQKLEENGQVKLNKSNKNIVLGTLILELLNNKLRPFLRKWHETFRHYWKISEKEFPKKNPIERQKAFPRYKELLKDIKELQKLLKESSNALYEVSRIKGRRNYWIGGFIIVLIIVLAIVCFLFYSICPKTCIGFLI